MTFSSICFQYGVIFLSDSNIIRVKLVLSNMFKSSSKSVFYRPFQGGASFVHPLSLFVFHVCLTYCLVCFVQPCSDLMG